MQGPNTRAAHSASVATEFLGELFRRNERPMSNIRVLADDGSIHVFPDNTDTTVINGVLGRYHAALAQNIPYSPQQVPQPVRAPSNRALAQSGQNVPASFAHASGGNSYCQASSSANCPTDRLGNCTDAYLYCLYDPNARHVPESMCHDAMRACADHPERPMLFPPGIYVPPARGPK